MNIHQDFYSALPDAVKIQKYMEGKQMGAVPNLSTNAEHPASTMEYQLWEQLREVKEENLALRADMAELKAENAELRKKLMTNFERLKNVGTVNEAAEMIYDALWRYVVDIDINYITAWLESRNNT